MTVRELCRIFSAGGKTLKLDLYANNRELQGTIGAYADAEILFVRDCAIEIEAEPLKYENEYVTLRSYNLRLSIEVEV